MSTSALQLKYGSSRRCIKNGRCALCVDWERVPGSLDDGDSGDEAEAQVSVEAAVPAPALRVTAVKKRYLVSRACLPCRRSKVWAPSPFTLFLVQVDV